MKAFPGVCFTTPKMGYRAVVAGTRLAVWEVAATLLSNAGDVALTARDLGIAPDRVDVCARYYTAFQAEVDAVTAELDRGAATTTFSLTP